MNANNMVSFEITTLNPPAIAREQALRLSALAAVPDTQIDYSDLAPSTKTDIWHRVSTLVPQDNKQQITLRLDTDVLKFFKATGKRYQSRINAALREYIGARGGSRMYAAH